MQETYYGKRSKLLFGFVKLLDLFQYFMFLNQVESLGLLEVQMLGWLRPEILQIGLSHPDDGLHDFEETLLLKATNVQLRQFRKSRVVLIFPVLLQLPLIDLSNQLCEY